MIAIIDYKAGNTCSVQNALRRLNADFELTDDAEKINKADKVIFPGVGHAKAAMEILNEKDLIPVIKGLEQPVLGICLGMQLLCVKSEESNTNCLNIIPLDVLRLNNTLNDYKVPHMGWNTLSDTSGAIFDNLGERNHCYFVHSYYVPLSSYTIATSNYIHEFSSSIKKIILLELQFHPEKSGIVGEQIIKNFLENE